MKNILKNESFFDPVLINLDQGILWHQIILHRIPNPNTHTRTQWVKGIKCYFFKLWDNSCQGS